MAWHMLTEARSKRQGPPQTLCGLSDGTIGGLRPPHATNLTAIV